MNVNVVEKSVTIDAEHQDREVAAYIEDRSLRADPSHESSGDEFDTSNHEPGRFGLASNEEVLNNAFSAAEERSGGREAGILEGNTTGDMQELLTLEDGSQIYATPTNEYEGGTMVVDSKDNAIENNLRGPKIVNTLGGDACDTAVVEDKFGKQHIAKEGVEGELAKTDAAGRRYSKESVEDTMAAAYFAGNTDLHGANVIIKEDGNMTIIDNDGGTPQSTMANINKFTGGPLGLMSFDIQDGNTREKIYDTAIQIRSGEQEIPVDDATRHHQYAQDAADKAVRAAVVDSSYDLPSEHTPSNLKSAPDGYESFSDFSVGDTFVAVNEKGEKVDCTVDYVESDAIQILRREKIIILN